MKPLYLICIASFLSLLLLQGCSAKKPQPRQKVHFTQNWMFHLGDIDDGQNPALVDSSWRTLDLPHDWSIEGSFSKDNPAGVGGGALPGGIGWYRKSFQIPKSDSSKIISIDFDGIYHDSKVWINGHLLGFRPYGYSSFRYELTPFLHYGDEKNVIAVRVDNSKQPNSRWYSGSGIYRNVWLVKTSDLFVDHWGTYIITPQVNPDSATVNIVTTLKNKQSAKRTYSLTTSVFDKDGNKVASITSSNQEIQDSASVKQQLKIQNPALWSVSEPNLYKAVSRVKSNGKVLDIYKTAFGIRKFHFDAQKGFFLNGNHLKILGLCDHQNFGALGSAVYKRAIERRLQLLKTMGANALRTSHNPPSPELLQLADSLGFIVMDEAFDAWKKNKTKYGYYQYWDKWHKRDLQDMIRRDRNHPSIMIWSIGNEIPEQWDSSGTTIANELAGIVRKLDDTRPITSALNDPKPDNFIYRSGALDLVGFNYHNEWFKDFTEKFPRQKFIATETTSALATRGEYDMPSDSIRRWPTAWDKPFTEGNDDYTVPSYDNVSTPWGSTHEEAWASIKGKDYLSGMFIWTGFDYLGEPTPYGWPARSSYFGIFDLAGFPKDIYYMYKSEWTNKDVLHLFPHWNWQQGDTVDVWAYSSANKVELFLNGKSLGKKSKPDSTFHVWWRVPYKPGTIKAVAYKANGDTMMTQKRTTAGPPAKIILSADRSSLKANNRDLSYIKVRIVDKNGNLAPRADDMVHFSIHGNGVIAGVDNGNEVSHEPFKVNYRKAFNGLCQAIIKTEDTPGTITLTATSNGLQKARIVLKSH